MRSDAKRVVFDGEAAVTFAWPLARTILPSSFRLDLSISTVKTRLNVLGAGRFCGHVVSSVRLRFNTFCDFFPFALVSLALMLAVFCRNDARSLFQFEDRSFSSISSMD